MKILTALFLIGGILYFLSELSKLDDPFKLKRSKFSNHFRNYKKLIPSEEDNLSIINEHIVSNLNLLLDNYPKEFANHAKREIIEYFERPDEIVSETTYTIHNLIYELKYEEINYDDYEIMLDFLKNVKSQLNLKLKIIQSLREE